MNQDALSLIKMIQRIKTGRNHVEEAEEPE